MRGQNLKLPIFSLVALIVLTSCQKHSDPALAKGALKEKGIEFSSDSFIKTVRDGNVENVKLFLDAGMSPDTRDESGSTMLITAAIKNDSNVAQLLIDHGANVNARTSEGETALMVAALMNAVDTAKVLLAAGAELNAKDSRGETPLAHARSHNHSEVVDLLKAAGAEE